jgi:hypothetical protein
MQNVKANLLSKAKARKDYKLACFIALQLNVEGNDNIYLPNAFSEVSDVINAKQWAGYLGALAKEGKYVAYDDGENNGYWGQIV